MSNPVKHNAVEFKSKVLAECKRVIDERITNLSHALNDVMEAANNESKSSAGDKHETGKAMMQIEQEKISKQLSELKSQKNELGAIQLKTSNEKVLTGSLVETNKALFYVAVGIGKVNIDNREVIVISPLSPIGKIMLGLSEKKSFVLNGINYEVLEIG